MLQSGKRELHLLPNISLLQPLLLKHSLKTRPQTVIQYFLSLVVYWLSSWQLNLSYGKDFRRITSSTNFEWPLSFRKLTSFINRKRRRLPNILLSTVRVSRCFIIPKTSALLYILLRCFTSDGLGNNIHETSRKVARKIRLRHTWERVLRCHLTTLYSYAPHLRTSNIISVGSVSNYTYCEFCFTRSSKFKPWSLFPGRSRAEISLFSLERSIKPRTVIAFPDLQPRSEGFSFG